MFAESAATDLYDYDSGLLAQSMCAFIVLGVFFVLFSVSLFNVIGVCISC